MVIDIPIVLPVILALIPVGIAVLFIEKSERGVFSMLTYLRVTYPDKYAYWTNSEIKAITADSSWTGPIERFRVLKFIVREIPEDQLLRDKITIIQRSLIAALWWSAICGIVLIAVLYFLAISM